MIGAICLILVLPLAQPLVMYMSSPEFLCLIILAVVLMQGISGGSMLKGTISSLLGFLFAFVGLEGSTGTPRFTMDQMFLWDGFKIVPVALGLFAVAEMMNLMTKGGSIRRSTPHTSMQGTGVQMLQGIKDVFVHWRVTIQSSLIGLWVGIAPGVGGVAGQFIAYGQAKRSAKPGPAFGTGRIEGVIASDAVGNANDGGGLLPTLGLGIPGSTSGAILIAAFISFGIQPGREMIDQHGDMVWMIVWLFVFANFATAIVCFMLVPGMSKLTVLNSAYVVGPVLVIALSAALATSRRKEDVLIMVLIGLLGFAFIKLDFSRVSFLIGFVLAPLLEHHYRLTAQIYGASFLLRPMSAILLLIALWVLGRNLYITIRKPEPKPKKSLMNTIKEALKVSK